MPRYRAEAISPECPNRIFCHPCSNRAMRARFGARLVRVHDETFRQCRPGADGWRSLRGNIRRRHDVLRLAEAEPRGDSAARAVMYAATGYRELRAGATGLCVLFLSALDLVVGLGLGQFLRAEAPGSGADQQFARLSSGKNDSRRRRRTLRLWIERERVFPRFGWRLNSIHAAHRLR